MELNIKKYFANFDFSLIIAICILSIIGIICIGSATHINLGESKTTFLSQILWFVVGLVLLVITMKIDYMFFSQFYIIFYVINILLLVAVLFFGTSVNGATRWIRVGPVGIQPSEFAKIIMIFCLAKHLDKEKDRINNIPILLVTFISVSIPVYLIQKQPSLSASIVIIAIFLVVLFVVGLSYKYIAIATGIAIPTSFLIFLDIQRENPLIVDKIFAPHQVTRILTFIDPGSNPDTYYQTIKSINAIGSGQLTGKGLYQGTLNQLSYLPEPHNDFIFSVIGEEFGFVGCMAILALLLFIIFRCMLIALSTRDMFSQLIVCGVAGMIAVQTFVNAGVAMGILPNTGMSLPFVSYGGSSIWTNMISIGLVLNIGKRRSKSLFEGV